MGQFLRYLITDEESFIVHNYFFAAWDYVRRLILTL